MARMREDIGYIFRSEQPGRTVGGLPRRDMVGHPAEDEKIAGHFGQIDLVIDHLDLALLGKGKRFEDCQKIAHQTG